MRFVAYPLGYPASPEIHVFVGELVAFEWALTDVRTDDECQIDVHVEPPTLKPATQQFISVHSERQGIVRFQAERVGRSTVEITARCAGSVQPVVHYVEVA